MTQTSSTSRIWIYCTPCPPTQGATAPCQSLRCQLEALQEIQLHQPDCHHESAERGDCAGSAWTLLLGRGREKEEVEEEAEKEEEDTDNLKSNDLHLTSCRKKPANENNLGIASLRSANIFDSISMKCSMFLHVRSHVTYRHLPWKTRSYHISCPDGQHSEQIILEGILKDLEGNNRTFQVLIQKINVCKFLGQLDCLWFGIPSPTVPAEPRNVHSCVPLASGHSCTTSRMQENEANL